MCNYLGIISFIVKKIGVTLALIMVSFISFLACCALCVLPISDYYFMQCRVHRLLVSPMNDVFSVNLARTHTFIRST